MFVVGALHALSNPPPAFTRLCTFDSPPAQQVLPSLTAVPTSAARWIGTAEIERICHAYESGETITQIAKRFGVHRSTLYVRLESAGVRLRPRGALTSSQARRAAELYGEGQSLAQIGGVFGVDAQTVRNHLVKDGVAIRKRRGWS